MFFDAAQLDARQAYRLLNGSVVPRPIAWVTSGAPLVNLAPFSAFAWVSQDPPMLGFNVVTRPTGDKDTLRNIERLGEYVVNIAEKLHASSEGFDASVSEPEHLGIELAPSRIVGVPRLANVPVSMECQLEQVVRFSATGGNFVVGRVVAWHVRDDVLDGDRIDMERMRPVGRLAGPRDAPIGEIIELPPVPGG
jgi:flavin reductase (DIM6/NTAB) family NADH-FMN oxidoreductase RutF